MTVSERMEGVSPAGVRATERGTLRELCWDMWAMCLFHWLPGANQQPGKKQEASQPHSACWKPQITTLQTSRVLCEFLNYSLEEASVDFTSLGNWLSTIASPSFVCAFLAGLPHVVCVIPTSLAFMCRLTLVGVTFHGAVSPLWPHPITGSVAAGFVKPADQDGSSVVLIQWFQPASAEVTDIFFPVTCHRAPRIC